VLLSNQSWEIRDVIHRNEFGHS